MSTLISSIAAMIVIVSFIGLSIFQLLLAMGKPYGKLAFGGRYEVLPTNYRIMSAIAILVYLVASFFVLIRIELITGFPFPDAANIGVWLFAFYLLLNTLMNAVSKSESEKKIMTPISFITSLGLFIIALGL